MYITLQQGGNSTSSSLLLDLIPPVSCSMFVTLNWITILPLSHRPKYRHLSCDKENDKNAGFKQIQ